MSLFNSDYQPISTATPATAATHEPAATSTPVPVKGKAVTYSGTYSVGLVDVNVPEVVKDDDVVVKITATTLCGSDLHLWHGEATGIAAGTVLGHECVGIVDKVGSAVKNLKEGDRVVVASNIACGECRFCKQKITSMCERTAQSIADLRGSTGQRTPESFGCGHLPGKMPGAQAEYARVPVADFNCLKIPDEVPDEKGIKATSNGVKQYIQTDAVYINSIVPLRRIKDTGIKDGDIVGIWGLGPIGQAAVRFAALAGARRIYAIDKLDSRLALARQGAKPGVVQTINYQQLEELDDVVEFIQAKCPEGLDCAIDATSTHEPKSLLHKAEKVLRLESDNPNVVNECIRSVRKMGRVGVVSSYPGAMNHFNMGAVMEKGIRLFGNGTPPVHLYWQEILDKIVSDELDPTFLITQRIRLEDVPDFYPVWASRVPSIQKVFAVTRFGPEKAHPGTPALTSNQQLERLDGGRRRSSLLVTVQQMGGRRRSSFLQSMLSEGKTYLDKALGTAQ
ncbi:hypothetical protein QFC22_003758 [Naganishia vaughanmartiniae]|uniref:Uncharacterized protein n=1 Tax=Naganishia vaughanmartiniae TaxID=1424756 RepID=A0ACC2X3B4_9TREE|nr:hypothetical protein QFC22_003758 [Naganishia vaughanmartiniae]